MFFNTLDNFCIRGFAHKLVFKKKLPNSSTLITQFGPSPKIYIDLLSKTVNNAALIQHVGILDELVCAPAFFLSNGAS